MLDQRPTADALLERIKHQDRARLRIYVGAAPGVGKTYEMLQEAHALKTRGLDVVVGFVETYGRRDTEAQVKDLEVIPRRRIEYRGVTMEEMDVDAIVQRKPQVCLVDELAHTNVPGSRNAKRYQDVLEILDAGIHVMTAVNIQHLETLNDAVARATGVRVRETVPDTFLDRANEVINVDVTVEELRNRLREGKIYRPEKIEQALTNFFRKGNLSTLRELALRAVADEVSDKAASYRGQGRPRAGADPRTRHGLHELECTGSAGDQDGLTDCGTPRGALVRGLRRDAARKARTDQPERRRCLVREHPARGKPGCDGRAREGRFAVGGIDRVCTARGGYARHLRPERANAVGGHLARVDARQVSRRRARCRRAGCPAHRELSMVSHTADRTTQRPSVRRPGWFGSAVAVGVPAAVGLVWFMAVAHVIVGAVIAVGAAVAWCIWLERHA